MENCKKCGIHLKSNNHDEKTCDFEPINFDKIEELTHVEDIEIEVSICSGYGVWELSIMHNIMNKLWENHDPKFKSRHPWLNSPINTNLFDEAEKIYNE